ncbi:phage head-tail connector protein [Lactobacillus sp. 3B(2020)]|uniref:phage head-tail connector protein n=1 Tax=Lactobacillus sp. 3B(2020) TaxID=2695882 RepID=UPI0015DF7CAB|nr:phage head-tail connector protein [Lactobacillus sp. 3B(2020)]QLL69788.1 hypothetical protein GTO83_04165 [Lactobacillus sp. 3B(2020)]
MAEVLDEVKTMLRINDNGQDDLLNLIITNTERNLNFKLQTETVPDELRFIELEVCIRRFNRLKNEGMASYSQEGESITFNSNDFDDFLDDLNEWKRRNQKDIDSLGHVAFINAYGGDSRANDQQNQFLFGGQSAVQPDDPQIRR